MNGRFTCWTGLRLARSPRRWLRSSPRANRSGWRRACSPPSTTRRRRRFWRMPASITRTWTTTRRYPPGRWNNGWTRMTRCGPGLPPGRRITFPPGSPRPRPRRSGMSTWRFAAWASHHSGICSKPARTAPPCSTTSIRRRVTPGKSTRTTLARSWSCIRSGSTAVTSRQT